MSKAILVMDMPQGCAHCKLADDDDLGGWYCILENKYFGGIEIEKDRANFCPLRELPDIAENV